MIIIYDSKETNFNNNGLGTLNPSLCTITEITNSEYSVSLRHGFDANNKWKLIETDRVIKAKGQYFRIAKVQETLTEIVAYAIHIFYDLNKNFIEDSNVVDKTGSQALSHILSSTVYPHNFTATSDITNITGSRLVRKNVVQCLLSDDENSFMNRWGGEIKRDNFSFSINQINGNDNGVNINYGKNLTGLTATFDFSDVITKIIPIAYDGVLLPEKYVDSPLIDNYSSPIIREVKFEDVKYKYSPNNSSEEGFETLNEVYAELRRLSNLMYSEQRVDIPSSTYDVNFVELSKTDQYKNYRQLETVEIGDYVRVFWEKTNINIKARCVSYVYDVLRDRYESIKLGSYSESLFSNINTTIKNNSISETVITDMINVSLDEAVDKVTILIQNGLGGYVVKTRDELLIMDTDDIETATFVWRWNINGLGFSSTGYNGTYGLAMTHDGQIVADKITSGELNGEIIKGNSISVNKLEVEAVRKIEAAQSESEVRTILMAELGSFKVEIDQTVTSKLGDFYTKEETNSAINIRAGEISSEVSSMKESGFGGNNLILNGNFSSGDHSWKAIKYSGLGTYEFAVFNQDNTNIWALNNKKIGWCSVEDIPIGTPVTGEWSLQQEFDTVIGQSYTISYYIAGHRSSKSVVVRNGAGTAWDNVSEEKWYGHLNGGRNDSGWVWDSITFIARHEKSVIWFRMHSRLPEYDDMNNMYLWVTDVCCVEGANANKWIPNIDEYYNRTESITLIEQTSESIKETLNTTIEISKNEAINQASLDTNNKLNSYPTKIEMNVEIDKRADGIVSTVEKVEKSLVVDNLLMEGDFSNNLYSWEYYDQGYPVTCEAQNSSDWIMTNKTALHLSSSYHPQGIDSGVGQTFYTKWYTNYTITGYVASHRAEGIVVLKDDAGNWLTFDKTNADSDDYTGGNEITRWKRVKFTYYSGERGQLQLCLGLAKSNDNGQVWFHDFMITEGDEELFWKPSVRETRTQISQLDDKIETKASIDNMSTYIQQNPYAVMASINNEQGTNGINIDKNGVSVFRNQIRSILFNDGVMKIYNSTTGAYMGYYGTDGDDLRVSLTGASTFSIRGGNDAAMLMNLNFNDGQMYGNAKMELCGDLILQHQTYPEATGVNGLGLGNDDRSDTYGHHNMFIVCHNSMGIVDNNGLTNMFADARRGRWIMKGGLYQNTSVPPSTFMLSTDAKNTYYSGITKTNIVDSVLNLDTTIFVDNDRDISVRLLSNDDDLMMTDIGGIEHLDQASIVSGLVEVVKSLKAEIEELKKVNVK